VILIILPSDPPDTPVKVAGYFKEQTLLDQPFFKNPEKTIGQYAKENNATIVAYKLYTIG
jgi:translation elongation factor EF-Ts